MALSLLAGPITLTYKGQPVVPVSSKATMWADEVGFVFGANTVDGYLGGLVAGLDGVARHRGSSHGDVFAAIVHNLSDKTLALWLSNATEYDSADPFVFAGQGVSYPVDWQGPFAIVKDRWLSCLNQTLYFIPLHTAAAAVSEVALPVHLNQYGWITPGRFRNSMMIAGQSGVGFEYDWVEKSFFGFTRQFGITCSDGVFYSKRLGVWLTFSRATGPTRTEMRIWADEVVPVNASDPVAGGNVEKGRPVTMQSTLTGAHGDPCIGFPVNWSIVAGQGFINPTQSVSNENGTAETTLILGAQASGNIQIQADWVF